MGLLRLFVRVGVLVAALGAVGFAALVLVSAVVESGYEFDGPTFEHDPGLQ
jgi:hypothetical protein